MSVKNDAGCEKRRFVSLSEKAWGEWNNVCTIGRCDSESRRVLADFGRSRLYSRLVRYGGSLASDYCSPEANRERAWVQLEAYLYGERNDADKEAVTGKRYKDRIREDLAEAGISEIEGYLTKLFQREVTRRIVYEEGFGIRNKDGSFSARYSTVSLDTPIGDDGATLIDLFRSGAGGKVGIPSRMAGVQCCGIGEKDEGVVTVELSPETCLFEFDSDPDEFDDYLQGKADELWGSWSKRHRVLYTLMSIGMTPGQILETGLIDECGKSQLYEGCKRVREDIKRVDWGIEASERGRAALARRLIMVLREIALLWLKGAEDYKDVLSYIVDAQ